MKFVKKKVNINPLNLFITNPTKKGHTHSNKSSVKPDKMSDCV